MARWSDCQQCRGQRNCLQAEQGDSLPEYTCTSLNVVLETSEARHGRAKSRKHKDEKGNEGREKNLRGAQAQQSPQRSQRMVDYDETRSSRSREKTDQLPHEDKDRLKKKEKKEKRLRKDDSTKKDQGQETRRQFETDNRIPVAHSPPPDGSDGYEDDFEEEDGSEDVPGRSEFEEDKLDISEVEALRIAMKEENAATSLHGKDCVPPTSKFSVSNKPASRRLRQTFINFSAAKQRQIYSKASQRAVQRGRELMNLIELDVSAFSLFEMPPVKVYELYIKSYGRSNSKQAFVQCHDDVFDRDVQTEPIKMKDNWIQHPSEGISTFIGYDRDKQSDKEDVGLVKMNSLRLSTFLEKAVQVMNAVLEEDISDGGSHHQSNPSNIFFSDGYTRLNSDLSVLRGRYASYVQFHPVQTNLLVTVHSRPEEYDDHDSSQRSIVCVWNVSSSSRPHRILTCRSEVKSCCFSPIKATFVFAGTADGAILVWDLRGPPCVHQNMLKDEALFLQVPTFSTYGANKDENHESSVVRVQPVMITEDNHRLSMPDTSLAKQSEMNGLSFQLVSLDEQGVIHFWVVIDLEQTDDAGSETDLGLVPSGRLKLLKSSSIILENPFRNVSQAIQARDMKFSSKDPTQFFIATDSGCILHGSRHGDRISPRHYGKPIDSPIDAIKLDFSPFGLPYFLAGSSDGCVCLYSLSQETPLLTWSNSTSNIPVAAVKWSRSRPSVFYVLDVTSKMHVWELLTCQEAPVKTQQFSNGRLLTMELSNDHTALGRRLPGRPPVMVVAYDSGVVDVHLISQHFTASSSAEFQEMTKLLNSFR
ncbi:WD repeat-containing protein 60-like isoform X2 [Acanthaster planci]|uniref:WD repeat-containing protein 60-like isoform X2 n=1 Tax=Acanthaster planci TaxID=133434 RepID=A0A8B7ZEE5_ACAPL|nr:WD repeat-containing protein 60-like isoform X2 [Acanthaster planci]